ncbi:Uncharacterized protein QTN25_005228 [Entamoeba marina]
MSSDLSTVEVLCSFIDQTATTLALGTTHGFIIYGIENKLPYVRFKRTFGKGIGLICPLNRTNLVALVGGGYSPFASRRSVIVWDDNKSETIFKKDFSTEVTSILLTKERLFVSLEHSLNIFSLTDSTTISLQTSYNPNGVFMYEEKTGLLVTLYKTIGTITFYNMKKIQPTEQLEEYGDTHENVVHCFKKEITALTRYHQSNVIVVFSVEKSKFVFIDSKTKQKYGSIKYPTAIICSNTPIVLMTQVILVVCIDDVLTIFDILKKKNKIFSTKLPSSNIINAFLNPWGGDSVRLNLIDKNGVCTSYEITVSLNATVRMQHLSTRDLFC